MKWIRPNTITGSVAQGAKYFRRKDIEDKIWHELQKGNSVLFLAPRRVGKSSIISYMADNPADGFCCKYEDIESDSSIQDFYKRLIRMSLDSLTKYGKVKKGISGWWNSWTIESIGKDNVGIVKAEVDHRKEFKNLLGELKKNEEKVALFLDEFPDVILKLSKNNEAEQLLEDVRHLCHDDQFKGTFTLVLLGSVGLAHIVKQVTGRSHKINQLHKEHLPSLERTKAEDFLDFLLQGATMKLGSNEREYLLNKVGNFIPFYIQLLIEECDDSLYMEQREKLTCIDIDKAYASLLKKNEHFQDWDERLSKYFSEKYRFLHQVLTQCARKGSISLLDILDIGVKYGNDLYWKADIDDILVADGYITADEDNYTFISPLMRDWWKLRHP